MRIVGWGHAVFATTVIALGLLGLIHGGFTAVFEPVPKGLPAREAFAYLCAIVCLATGFGLLWPRSAAISAQVLWLFFLFWTLLVKARFIVLAPLVEGSYQSCGENAVVIAAAWVLYARFATAPSGRGVAFAIGDRGVRNARVLYALAMIAFGLSHFFYLNLTAPLVPAWLPAHVFWAYFTGVTYLLAGMAILAGRLARQAAVLSTLQMGLFTLLVWMPLIVAGPMNAEQWGELVVSWTLTASAWVVADSYSQKGTFWRQDA
jgi:uncharacterized membrane protein